jgi:Tfp pilus assembly protein PilX
MFGLKLKNSEKGAASILLAILILGVLFIIGSGVSVLIMKQMKMSTDIGHSTRAFYAAEAGAEKCLFQVRQSTGNGCDSASAQVSGTLDNSSSYDSQYDSSNDEIISTGNYLDTNRRVRLTW